LYFVDRNTGSGFLRYCMKRSTE